MRKAGSFKQLLSSLPLPELPSSLLLLRFFFFFPPSKCIWYLSLLLDWHMYITRPTQSAATWISFKSVLFVFFLLLVLLFFFVFFRFCLKGARSYRKKKETKKKVEWKYSVWRKMITWAASSGSRSLSALDKDGHMCAIDWLVLQVINKPWDLINYSIHLLLSAFLFLVGFVMFARFGAGRAVQIPVTETCIITAYNLREREGLREASPSS